MIAHVAEKNHLGCNISFTVGDHPRQLKNEKQDARQSDLRVHIVENMQQRWA